MFTFILRVTLYLRAFTHTIAISANLRDARTEIAVWLYFSYRNEGEGGREWGTFLMEKHDPLLRYYKSILRRLEGARLYVKARSNFFNLD